MPRHENLTSKALRCGSHSFTCQHTTPAFTRSSPGGTTTEWTVIAPADEAYYSLIDLVRMKGWVGLVGWPTIVMVRPLDMILTNRGCTFSLWCDERMSCLKVSHSQSAGMSAERSQSLQQLPVSVVKTFSYKCTDQRCISTLQESTGDLCLFQASTPPHIQALL